MNISKIYIAVGIVTFLLFIILFAPAKVIWRLLDDKVSPSLFSLSHIEGTFWQGSADLTGKFLPPGEIEWQINPIHLITGKVMTHLSLHGSFHNLTTSVSMESKQLHINELSGSVQAEAVNPLIDNYGFQVSGNLDLQDLNLHLAENWIEHLSGNLEWSGGMVKYSTFRSAQLYELPPLAGDLMMQSTVVVLDIKDITNELAVLAVRLDRNGWGKVILKGRLFDLAAQPWPIQGAPDDVVLEVEEKIW